VVALTAFGLALAAARLEAQGNFPAAVDGQHYYCPRIDLNPPAMGGPLSIEPDGVLDEVAWQKAHFQGYSSYWTGGQAPTDESDADPQWAVVADDQYLYVAWRMTDEAIQTGGSPGCGLFNDDAFEFYLDFLNDGQLTHTYGPDDIQLLVGADQMGKEDPFLLESSWFRNGGCQFNGPAVDPNSGDNVVYGVVTELDSAEGAVGWQGEIAIALEQVFNGEWSITPTHGATIGWDVHIDDDDTGGGQECALIWSKGDPTSQAWRDPGVWGKLQFVTPGKPLARVERDIASDVYNGHGGLVTLTASPVFGGGTVTIVEDLPAFLVPSSPTLGGTVNGNKVTWNLGALTETVTVSYTMTPTLDAIDVDLPGGATIDGEPLAVVGDTRYTGGPITPEGFIKLWNHLGPFSYVAPAVAGDHGPPGACDANGGLDLTKDWIVNEDESVTELDILPFPGLITKPNYGGNGFPGGTGARAAGLITEPGDLGAVKTDQFPVWKSGVAPFDTVDHAASYALGFDADDHVTLSCIYVTNHTGASIDTQLGLGSDDSIQVFVNDQDVTAGGIAVCRGWGAAQEEQSIVPVTLPSGESRILVKISDGVGASGFRLRFQDPSQDLGGLLPPDITLSTESTASPPPAKVERDLSATEFPIGGKVDVSLKVTAPSPVGTLRIHEVLPTLCVPSEISNGGVLTGGVIEWTLTSVSNVTLTYKLEPGSCIALARFGQSTWEAGPYQALLTGESELRGPSVVDEDLGAWENVSVGTGSGKAQSFSDTDVLVEAGGDGIRLTTDSFHFIHVPASGDFEISAKIECVENALGAGLAGLMVRDTLDATAAFGGFYVTLGEAAPGNFAALKASARRETNTSKLASTINFADKDVSSLPVWLKIKRTGATLSFQRSANGTDFSEVVSRGIGTAANQIKLGDATLIGLALTGGVGDTIRATFRDVAGLPALPSFREGPKVKKIQRGDADQNNKLELTDAVQILGFLFLGSVTKVPDCFDAADADDNGKIELTDAVRILGFLFLGGPPPASPGPPPDACGPDPTGDDTIACEAYAPCP